MTSSTSLVTVRPPPRRPPGPEPKPMTRPVYEAPPRVNHIKRSYPRRRKIQVLLFIENHRIPLQQDLSDLVPAKVVGDSPVEAGFRRPFLREAAAYFGIQSWGTVQTWWSKRHQILKGHRFRRYRPRWPEMEVRLYSEFCAARERRRLVQTSWFKRRATAIFADLYPEIQNIFAFSNGWFRAFLRRHQITNRRVTHAATKVPDEIVRYTNEFLQFIRRNSRMGSWQNVTLMSDGAISMRRFPPHLIINLDETPMPFEFLSGFTYDHKGTDSVQGRSERSGWSKRQATLVLSLVADGSQVEELRPVIIFHGKGTVLARESCHYNPGVDVKFNDTAYNNETLFEEWIKTRLAAYTEGRDCLLVIDVARFHKTPKIQDALKAHNITAALIPPGLTGYLQPLDVGFNGPFKKWLREETDLYLERLDSLGTTPEKWTTRDRRIMTTHVVAHAWQRAFTAANKAMVTSLFQKTGISIHPDGREDNLISIKGIDSSKLCLDEWYRPPKVQEEYDMSEALARLEEDEFVSITEALRSTPVDYNASTVKELKAVCKQRGLYVTGRKSDLVQRLKDHDAATTPRQQEHRDERMVRGDERSDQMAGHDGTQLGQQPDLQVVQPTADPVYDPIGFGTRAVTSSALEPDDDEDTPDAGHASDE